MRSLIRKQHAESARAGQIQRPDVLQVSVACTGRGPRRASFDPRRSAAAWQDALAASQPYFRWLAVALGVWLGLRAHPIATRVPTPPACATITAATSKARNATGMPNKYASLPRHASRQFSDSNRCYACRQACSNPPPPTEEPQKHHGCSNRCKTVPQLPKGSVRCVEDSTSGYGGVGSQLVRVVAAHEGGGAAGQQCKQRRNFPCGLDAVEGSLPDAYRP